VKRSGPIKRKTPLERGKPMKRTGWKRTANGAATTRRAPIKPVSKKRQAEQRERVKMLKAETGGVPVACERCDAAEANDAHEIVPRSAGGSITDRENVVFLCRPCHRWIGDNPAQAMADGWLARPDTP